MHIAGFMPGLILALLVMLNSTESLGSLLGGAVVGRLASKSVASGLYLLAAVHLCGLPFAHGTLQTYLLAGTAGVSAIGNTMLRDTYFCRYCPPLNLGPGIGWVRGIGRFGAIARLLIGGALAQAGAPLLWNLYAF
ncbi:MFS transporter [Paraburkholderia mimosarum]|uniref:hypothetical protein n=1 Tax=Paraburkholderia mimosarum TaxID=312026 RepID=UPI0003FAB845|nr:hypothetical protein [Paraburkholderia mimosarum]